MTTVAIPPEPSFTDHLPLTSVAVRFAERRHAGQRRASDSAPFVLHPLEVASMLDRSGYPDHVVAAAVLHDVLEDTDSERSELEALFGREVSDLVAVVSDDPGIADEWERKADVRERVREAGGYALPVFAADKISKVRELRALLAGGLSEAEAAPRLDVYAKALEMLDQTAPGGRLTELLRFELETIARLPPGAERLTARAATPTRGDVELLPALLSLRRALLVAEERNADAIAQVPAQNRTSAKNLVHYVELRSHDLRGIQERLEEEGLSSLGRCEPHTLATLEAVLALLQRLEGGTPGAREATVGFGESRRLIGQRTRDLLGPSRDSRPTRLMVTAPSEAATDGQLLERMLAAGMDCLRINCAHDDPEAWEAMVENLRRAERRLDRACRVEMDLAGPKLRTGPLPPGPSVVKIRPHRDELGRVVAPARVWLTAAERPVPPPGAADTTLPLPAGWLASLPAGGRITMRDARSRLRVLELDGAGSGGGRWARLDRTAYVLQGTILWSPGEEAAPAAVGELPALAGSIRVHVGDTLALTRDQEAGDPERRAIPCTLDEVFGAAAPGDPIWFDDGRIGGMVATVSSEEIAVRVTHAAPGGTKLRADKGINLPRTELPTAAITEADEDVMPFVARHADLVGLSFVSSAADVHRARALLREHGGDRVGIVLKVETDRGFRALPELLLAALEHGAPSGVMIARGDLAVECGYERLAEVQEEILWLAEAAHVPVIWATQVLEGMAKTGQASRAEITDAAMGARAECVMLNKGPRIFDALHVLDDILIRMQAHHRKKQSLLRELRSFSDAGGSQHSDDPALLTGP